MGPVGVPAPPRGRAVGLLKDKLQPQLNGAVAARSNDGVGSGDVRSGAAATEATRRRIIKTETILATVRIGEVGMIEDIEELSPELGAEPLAHMPVLRQREIHIAETRIGESVAAHIAECPQCWRNHDGVTFGIAAKQVEGSRGCARTPAVQSQRL